MNQEVLLKIALAKQYAHHANFAGTARQAVADGYSAVDSIFSALLLFDGIEPPKNHKKKYNLARSKYPSAFDEERVRRKNSFLFRGGADWDSLATFYEEWLASRYDTFDLAPIQASDRVIEVHAVIAAAIRFLAVKADMLEDDLEASASRLAFGYESSEVNMAVGHMHGRLSFEAENSAPGFGVKLAATTNYCALDIIAGDDITRSVLKDNGDIANEAALLYRKFIELVDKIDTERLRIISGGKKWKDCSSEEIDKSPDFMLSMKARFHGGSVEDMGKRWGRLLGKAMSGLASEVDR